MQTWRNAVVGYEKVPDVPRGVLCAGRVARPRGERGVAGLAACVRDGYLDALGGEYPRADGAELGELLLAESFDE
jgi:hypothetical protein